MLDIYQIGAYAGVAVVGAALGIAGSAILMPAPKRYVFKRKGKTSIVMAWNGESESWVETEEPEAASANDPLSPAVRKKKATKTTTVTTEAVAAAA